MGLHPIPRRPVRPRREGYRLHSGRLVDDLREYLVDEVCERYADGEFDQPELGRRLEAALVGDWMGAGRWCPPVRLQEIG